MSERDAQGADCLVIGGGLSGLACAQALCSEGHTVQLLEATDGVGGRARGFLHQGEPVDHGFQAVLRAYPETREFFAGIGLQASDLRPFSRSVAVYDGSAWRRVGPSPGRLLRQGLATPRDLATLARLVGGAAVSPATDLEDGTDQQTAAAGLDGLGLSPSARDLVLRPLLAGMLLDHDLAADFGYVRFLLAMLARGQAVLPVDGMGMIADRAATAITGAGGMIWTGVRVAALDLVDDGRTCRGVVLDDGRRVAARQVVLALDARSAVGLLRPVDAASARRLPTESSGMVSAAFALDEPLYAGRHMLIDAAAVRGDNRVDLVCQTTNITRPGSPGPHIVIAQSATNGWDTIDEDRYVAAVGERMALWAPRFPWARIARPIATFRCDWAQFRPVPGVRRDLPGPRTAVLNLFLAGDAVLHPSIEGAVASGRRAARIVHQLMK